MNPTVEAALIAGGVSLISLAGTVVVAVSGFRNSRRVTQETIAAAANSSLRDRLWDRRSVLYVDAIKVVERRSTRRRQDLEQITTGIPATADAQSADWGEVAPRLIAFAPMAVVEAWRAATEAHNHARDLYGECSDATCQDRMAAVKACEAAIEAARQKDNAVINAIRADLRSHDRTG